VFTEESERERFGELLVVGKGENGTEGVNAGAFGRKALGLGTFGSEEERGCLMAVTACCSGSGWAVGVREWISGRSGVRNCKFCMNIAKKQI
jgi:hypothetical protein